MPIYKVTEQSIEPVPVTSFQNEKILERRDLQRLIRDRIEIVSPGTLIISEEFSDWEDAKCRVDLLGLDEDANVVVIELKRDDTGSHMELQALRYAAMLSKLSFGKAVDVFGSYLQKNNRTDNPRETLLEFLGWKEPQESVFAQDVRIVLAAADFSQELTATVLWLNEFELDIRCVRLKPYRSGDQLLMDVQQLIPLPEAEDYQVKLREQNEERRESRKRDYAKFHFEGETHGKGRLVLAVVKAYLRKTPATTYEQLKAVFPDELQGSMGVFELAAKGKASFEKYRQKRYYIDPDDILVTTDGKEVAVSSQWSKDNIVPFCDRAKELGFEIQRNA